jgi:hypothetical protein
MVTEEARALALRLLASYPGWPVSEMSVIALAESLDRMGLDIAEAVVERARTELVKPPSIAQLYEVAHDIRVEEAGDRPALPASEGEIVAEMPDEVREKWHSLQAKWAEDVGRDLVAEEAEWQRVKTATLALLRMHGTCLGTDKPPVAVDGMLVCPVCRVEVART